MPQGFNIGPITIRFYAILILIGALLGTWVAAQLAKRKGKDLEVIWDVLPWLLIGGIIGARLWHVFTPSASNIAAGITTEYYLSQPIRILQIWNGGLGIPGGVVGGVIAALIYCKVQKLRFLELADLVAPGLLIAQAIGRLGNFVNQELYGGPSTLPWAIFIEPQYRLQGFQAVERYHPLFLYELILNLMGAGLLIWIGCRLQKKLFAGDIFNFYLIVYPAIRFALEFLRLDPSPIAGININQTVMLVVAVLAIIVFLLRHTIWRPKAEESAAELVEESEKVLEDETTEIDEELSAPDLDAEELKETMGDEESALDENESAEAPAADEPEAATENASQDLEEEQQDGEDDKDDLASS